MRDDQSTTYLASFRVVAKFGALVRAGAIRRGMGRAVRVVLGNGAAGIRELAHVIFGFAVQIIDQRCKQPACFGLKDRAQSILDRRCALMSGQLDLCWEGIRQGDYLRLRPVV
ncbi:MAG: hypothetical protein JJT96_06350 [Opitutales bacterium]|nr:hypothetical protein [Opitutales bacterium]